MENPAYIRSGPATQDRTHERVIMAAVADRRCHSRIAFNSKPVRLALAEDAAGDGFPIGGEFEAHLARAAKNGSRLPHRFRRTVESKFDCDLSKVRVQTGCDVEDLAALFHARSFCLGTNVFLGRDVLKGEPLLSAALFHELAHIATRADWEKIRCWEKNVHADITLQAFTDFGKEFDKLRDAIGKKKGYHSDLYNKTKLLNRLRDASSNMDYRERVCNPGATAAYGLGYIKGEGPRHGEGYNYTNPDPAANATKNWAEELKWINHAKNELATYFESPAAKLTPVGMQVTSSDFWINSLANALHVAEDRGSHREGTEGFGHNDPRVPPPPKVTIEYTAGGSQIVHWEYSKMPPWTPDDPLYHHDHSIRGPKPIWMYCNYCAYSMALTNSRYVMKTFFDALVPLKLGIVVHAHAV